MGRVTLANGASRKDVNCRAHLGCSNRSVVAYVWRLLREVKGRSDRLHGPSPRPWRSIFLIFGWVEWAGTGPPGQGSTTFSVHFFLSFFKFCSSFFVFS